jgi:hypothetical protein
MALTQAEQQELNALRQEMGYGPLGEPLAGTTTPEYSPDQTRKTALEIGAESLPMLGSLAATLIPGVGPMTLPARMGLSGAGAALGTAGKQAIETFGLNKPVDATRMALEYPKEFLLGAGAEGLGQVVGRGISKGATALRESPLGTRLFGPSISQADELAARQEVQRLLQRQGTTLGIQEAAPESTLFKVTERVSRIGPTKAASAKDIEMKNALSNEVSSLADELATNVLSREELGANLVSAQKQGRTKLYEDYGNNLSTLMDKEGAAPVSMVSVNNIGASAIKQAQEKLTEGSSAASLMGASGYKEAQDLLALKPDLTFKQANEVRSKLLEKQRELEKGTVGYNIVNRAVSEINTAMDAAAEAVSPTLKESYKALNSGYKQAINELDPKLLATAANKYPEKIADSIISSGNVSSWKETQMMLNRAKSLGVDTTGLAENIQRAYLEKTFADGGLTNISNKLKDKATAEQFKAILPEAVQNRAKVIAKAGEMLSQRGKSIDLATAATLSSVLGASAGNVYSGDSMGAGYGAVAGLASLVIAPKIAAKIAYSSVATNKLLQASTAASKGNATAAALKLGEMYREIKVSPQEIQQLQAGPQQAVPLSAQEQQELEALRKELGGQ